MRLKWRKCLQKRKQAAVRIDNGSPERFALQARLAPGTLALAASMTVPVSRPDTWADIAEAVNKRTANADTVLPMTHLQYNVILIILRTPASLSE